MPSVALLGTGTMEDLKWIAIIVALGAIAFLYLRLLGGGEERGS